MVSVLALDSAGSGCSAAVLTAGGIVAHRSVALSQGQAEALMPMIAAVLAEAALPVDALDLIAVTVGPGSFTGLRIGLAAARGLAAASGVPALGITSFSAVAAQVPPEARVGRRLVVALESKRREVYVQGFAADGELEGEAALVDPADFAYRVDAGPLLLAGDAAPRLAAALPEGRARLAPGSGVADAADVARLAAAAWRPGLRPPQPRPLYLRAADTTKPRPGSAVMRRLREIEVRDLGRLARLHAECFPDDRWDARALAELLAMAGASGRLVEDVPGVPVGFILDLRTGDQVEIITLAVAPAARRQGVALLLIDDLFARARAAQARSVTLEVAADNVPARRLYEGRGFAATGQRPSYYRRGDATVDALLLRRTLLG